MSRIFRNLCRINSKPDNPPLVAGMIISGLCPISGRDSGLHLVKSLQRHAAERAEVHVVRVDSLSPISQFRLPNDKPRPSICSTIQILHDLASPVSFRFAYSFHTQVRIYMHGRMVMDPLQRENGILLLAEGSRPLGALAQEVRRQLG
jgi:hypothetical protein